jgi:hypothetical protein
MSLHPPRHLELLAIQAEPSLDGHGRITGCHGVTIASCHDGQLLWIGADVPDATAAELAAAFDRAPPPARPHEPPPALALCQRILDVTGEPLHGSSGPSYLIPLDTHVATDAVLLRSGDDIAPLRGANPGNWHPVEWDELLDGLLGPWAIILHGHRAISICHTPGPLTERAAECGVWTDPQFRGRGYAAATAAAWIPLVRSPTRHLFYSTHAENLSSQHVARRLNLPAIGWTWRLHRPRAQIEPALHPLCSLSRPASK